MSENKHEFIRSINNALVVYGNGRYDHLLREPLHYEEVDGMELVYRGNFIVANVTMDSLIGILVDLGKNADRI